MPASEAIKRAYAIPQEEEISRVPPIHNRNPAAIGKIAARTRAIGAIERPRQAGKQAAQRGAKKRV
jgi:hypothetical protein